MNGLNLLFEQITKLLEMTGLIHSDNGEEGVESADGLFGEEEDKAKVDGFNGKEADGTSLSDEQIESAVLWREIKELKADITSKIAELYKNGEISEDLSNQIDALLSGKLTEEDVQSLKDIIDAQTLDDSNSTVLSSQEEIQEYLDSMTVSSRDSILEQIGGVDQIDSIVASEGGITKINTKDMGSITLFESGRYVLQYDNEDRTGFDTYNEQGQVTKSMYVDHKNDDHVVYENTEYNEDGSSVKTISSTADPDIRCTVSSDSDNNITEISTENVKTGEVTVDFKAGSEEDCQGSIDALSGDLENSNSELDALIQEQTEVQEDLGEQQDTYSETSDEMDAEMSDFDCQISSGESDLADAQGDLSDAKETVSECQEKCDESAATVQEDEEQKSDCEEEVEECTEKSDECQEASDTKCEERDTASEEMDTAASESDTANDELTTATNETNDAQNVKDDTGADLIQAIDETSSAFSLLNQEQAKVDAAQREYDNAQRQSRNCVESLWNKFKNWVSSAWNALASAVTGRDIAKEKYEKKQAEEEQARREDEAAQKVLDDKRREQDKATDVADAAQRVLELKTDTYTRVDQEYADALLDLADALLAQQDAEGKYDGAVEKLLADEVIHFNDQGVLCDAEGNELTCKKMVDIATALIQDLQKDKSVSQASYQEVLDATVVLITTDEADLQEIGEKITALREQIAEQEKELALQEEMMAQMKAEREQIEAAQNAGGIGDDVAGWFGGGTKGELDDWNEKRNALLAAIQSGNPEDLQAAYKLMYGNNSILVDDKGNPVDVSEMSTEQIQQMITDGTLTNVTVAQAGDAAIRADMDRQAADAAESANVAKLLENGVYVFDGHEVTQEDILAALEAQVLALDQDMADAINHQGWLSTGISYANDVLGIGTSQSEGQAQIDALYNLIVDLQNASSPTEFAAIYKAATGSNLDAGQVISLLSYNSMTGAQPSGREVTADEAAARADLTEAVTDCVTQVNDNAAGNPRAISTLSGTRAAEGIESYIQTQETATDAVIGVIDGVITAAAVAASPFTGGASLLLAAGIGAGVNVLLNASNSIYDANGDGSWDFNYTWKDFGKDALTGAINGMVSTGANSLGATVTSATSKSLATNAAATTFKEFARNTAIRYGSKALGALVEGAVDGGLSSGLNYMVDCAFEEDLHFSWQEFGQRTLQGAEFGAITNVGMTMGTTALGDVVHGFKSGSFADDVNKALADGSSGNPLADMVAGKLDGDLLVDGQINKWAVGQLMDNAQNSYTALLRAGFSEDAAMEFLQDASLNAQRTLPSTINSIRGGLKGTDAAEVQNLLKGLDADNVVTDNMGNVLRASSVLPDGTEVVFDFGSKGTLTGINFKGTLSEADVDQLASRFSLRGTDIEIQIDGQAYNPKPTANYGNTPEFAEYLSNKFSQQLGTIGEQDVQEMITRIANESGATEAEVQEVLSKLSQFSSYSQLQNLGEELQRLGVTDVFTIGKDGTVTLNNTKFQLFGEEHVTLNNAMQYVVGEKSQINLGSNGGRVFFLDDTSAAFFEELKGNQAAFDAFMADVQNGKIALVAVDGWAAKIDGVDVSHALFGSSISLEDSAMAIVQKMQTEGLSLDDIMNGDLINTTRAVLGNDIDIHVLSNSGIPGTSAADTAGLLAPLAPTPQQIRATIDTIVDLNMPASQYSPAEIQQAREVLSRYYDTIVTSYSAESLATEFKSKYGVLEQAVLAQGKTMDDVLYAIPQHGGSFDLSTYQFAKVNGIDADQIITWNGSGTPPVSLDGKTIVILDDIVGSGDSMMSQKFHYNDFLGNAGQDTQLIFSPLTSLQQGQDTISGVIANAGRDGVDSMIPSQIIDFRGFMNSLSPEDQNMLGKLLGDFGYKQGGACTGIPYMLPDNNSAASGLLLNHFLNNQAANKALYYDLVTVPLPGGGQQTLELIDVLPMVQQRAATYK